MTFSQYGGVNNVLTLSVAFSIIDFGRIICIKVMCLLINFFFFQAEKGLNKIKTDRTLSGKQNVIPKQGDRKVRDTRVT